MIIFVTGAHGVGKSTICSKLADKYNFRHLIASDLIKRGIATPNWSKDKIVDSPKSNQEILIEELEIEKKSTKKNILLDGHTVLKVKNGYHRLDDSYINRISPSGIILVTCAAEDVFNRNSKGCYSNIKDAENMLLEEDVATEYLKDLLKIPKLKVNTSVEVSYEMLNIFVEGLNKNDRS